MPRSAQPGRGPEGEFLAGSRMLQRQLRRVQINARRRRAAVKRIPENRKTALRRVDPNLVCPPVNGSASTSWHQIHFCILHSSFCLP